VLLGTVHDTADFNGVFLGEPMQSYTFD